MAEKKEKTEKPQKADKADKAKKGKPDAAAKAAPSPAATGPAVKAPPPRAYERYKQEIIPALAKRFNRTNAHSLPRLQKIILNMGVGKALQDKARMEQAVNELSMIAGQRPQI